MTLAELSFDPDSLEVHGGHFIAGRFVEDGEPIEVLRPSDRAVMGVVHDACEETVDRAVAAARQAYETSGWAGLAPRKRAETLRAWSRIIEENASNLARIESAGSTRLISETSLRDPFVAADLIRYCAEYADKLEGTITATQGDTLSLVLNEPYGVVGAIVPWNFPMINACMKIGPALATGNAIVIKPSELTPFSLLKLAELSVAAGLPDGLLNVINGYGPNAGAALVRHPDVRMISFTGSTGTGASIMAEAAKAGTKPVILELGGKSPMVVFADCKDIDRVAALVTRGFLYNAGQVCTTGSRLVVERRVKDCLLERVMELAVHSKPGPTWSGETSVPPIVSRKQIDRVDRLVKASIAEGARLLMGGKPIDGMDRGMDGGQFYEPTILDDVTPENTGYREEFFGPVLSIQSFDDPAEAARLADHPVYGLAASVFTSDIDTALTVARRIEAGTVWINHHGRPPDFSSPAGGYKGSGFGKDWGRLGIEGYLRRKAIWIAHG